MTYTVQILPVVARAIRKLPPEAKRRVQAMIELLKDDPRPPAVKKLTARPEWRVRSGDYRVLYRVENAVLTIIIVDAGHPRDIYRQAHKSRCTRRASPVLSTSTSEPTAAGEQSR